MRLQWMVMYWKDINKELDIVKDMVKELSKRLKKLESASAKNKTTFSSPVKPTIKKPVI